MPNQTYNIGYRTCDKCKTKVHIMYPELTFDDSGAHFSKDEQTKYLDDYVRAFGWIIEDGVYYCVHCAKKLEV